MNMSEPSRTRPRRPRPPCAPLEDALYRELFETMHDGFALHEILCDEHHHPVDYRFLDVNPAFEDLTGLKREDVVGRTVREVLPDTEDHWIQLYGRVALTGEALQDESYSQALDRWYRVSAFCPAPGRFAVIFTDVTKDRRTETLQAIIDHIPVMLTFYDAQGQFQLCNRELERVLGWTRDEVPRIDLLAAAYPDPQYRQEVRDFMLRPGAGWRDVVTTTKWGTTLETRWANVRLSDGARIGIGLDVTELKRYERELRIRRELAEHRAAQLQHLTLQLSQVEEKERRRIADILHEDLQQLLVGVRLHLDMVRHRVDDPPVLEVIERMNQLLDTAVRTSRGLSHDLAPPAVGHLDFAGVLDWLRRSVEAKHHLTVHLTVADDAEPPRSAATLLFRAVQELLFNVVKHAQTDEAAVDVVRDGGDLRITVRDSGCGFDADALWRKEGARGLGLLTIRERLAALGGGMHVQSAPGGGSRCVLRVPMDLPDVGPPEDADNEPADLDPTPDPDPAPDPDPPRRIRILLADDHKVVRQGLAMLLSDEDDLEVVAHAADGAEAVRLALAVEPDVIIMDVAMPHMDGVEATRQIHAARPDIRVIALSMFDREDLATRMHAAGAQRYLSKDGPSESLIAAIRDVMRP